MSASGPFAGVLVAVPNMGTVRAELVELLGAWVSRGAELYLPSGIKPTSRARNDCVLELNRRGLRWLCFVDSDTLPPIDALEVLLSAQVPAVTGLAGTIKRDEDGAEKAVYVVCRRNEAGDLKALTPGQVDGETPLQRIDASGHACILIEAHVFSKVSPPWYEERVWPTLDGRQPTGQDFVFCEKLEALGVPLFAHFGVVCLHRVEVDL